MKLEQCPHCENREADLLWHDNYGWQGCNRCGYAGSKSMQVALYGNRHLRPADAPPIRLVPAVDHRMETGPVQFGDDWPGVFVRGDDACHYAVTLRSVIEAIEAGEGRHLVNPVVIAVLRGIQQTMSYSDLSGTTRMEPQAV